MAGADDASTWAAPRLLKAEARRTVWRMEAASTVRRRTAPNLSLGELRGVCTGAMSTGHIDRRHAVGRNTIAQRGCTGSHELIEGFREGPAVDGKGKWCISARSHAQLATVVRSMDGVATSSSVPSILLHRSYLYRRYG
jgi:hypothetical protein